MKKFFVVLFSVLTLLMCGFASPDEVVDEARKGSDVFKEVFMEGCSYGYMSGKYFVFYGRKCTVVAVPLNDFVEMSMRSLAPGKTIRIDGRVTGLEADDFGTRMFVDVSGIRE